MSSCQTHKHKSKQRTKLVKKKTFSFRTILWPKYEIVVAECVISQARKQSLSIKWVLITVLPAGRRRPLSYRRTSSYYLLCCPAQFWLARGRWQGRCCCSWWCCWTPPASSSPTTSTRRCLLFPPLVEGWQTASTGSPKKLQITKKDRLYKKKYKLWIIWRHWQYPIQQFSIVKGIVVNATMLLILKQDKIFWLICLK